MKDTTLKELTKIFLILGMIVRAIFIFPIILGYFALKKIEINNEKDILVWGIISVLFVSTIAGVLMIVDSEVK